MQNGALSLFGLVQHVVLYSIADIGMLAGLGALIEVVDHIRRDARAK
jgi:hypothetical protein